MMPINLYFVTIVFVFLICKVVYIYIPYFKCRMWNTTEEYLEGEFIPLVYTIIKVIIVLYSHNTTKNNLKRFVGKVEIANAISDVADCISTELSSFSDFLILHSVIIVKSLIRRENLLTLLSIL